MKRVVPILVVGLALAGCGGSSHTGSSTTNSTAAARAIIITNWEKFFSGQTPAGGKVALLQNGSHFRGLVSTFASNPLAKNVSAKVSSVTLEGENKAKVVYVVKVGGSALPKQTGTAVRENGVWKVGDTSLCKLVSLQGSTPSVCKS